jgi:hypothetical protein
VICGVTGNLAGSGRNNLLRVSLQTNDGWPMVGEHRIKYDREYYRYDHDYSSYEPSFSH